MRIKFDEITIGKDGVMPGWQNAWFHFMRAIYILSLTRGLNWRKSKIPSPHPREKCNRKELFAWRPRDCGLAK